MLRARAIRGPIRVSVWSPRTWLYRIAANACLDTLRRNARRAVPAPAGAPVGSRPSIAAMPWLQPYPDSLLDELAAGQPGAAGYLRRPGQSAFFPFVLTVLRLEHGRVTDIAAFEQPSMFTAFGLPASL